MKSDPPHVRLQAFRLLVVSATVRELAEALEDYSGRAFSASLLNKIELGKQPPSCLHAVWIRRYMSERRFRRSLGEAGDVAITPDDWADAYSG